MIIYKLLHQKCNNLLHMLPHTCFTNLFKLDKSCFLKEQNVYKIVLVQYNL